MAAGKPVKISPGSLTLKDLAAAYRGEAAISLSPADIKAVAAGRQAVKEIVDTGRTVYGINTGFGALASRTIAAEDLEALQRNLIRSHAAGVGRPLDDDVVRLVLLLKIVTLAQGRSGVRQELVDALIALLDHRVCPVVPGQGSVGASGDLAPLAHLAGILIGEGSARVDGRTVGAAEALAHAGLKPLTLAPKEGLALINGTQVSLSLALAGLFAIENVFAAAVVAGAMANDAAMGSDTPFDPRIHQARNQPGQAQVAASYRDLLRESEIRQSHLECDRVQDPYSLRCQPQVMGALLDVMLAASGTLAREALAVTDNPLVFAEEGEILSGGNFHAEPVALAADMLAMAVVEIGNMSERRTALLLDEGMSGLPAFLAETGGLESGYMMAQVTAAALASENKQRAFPASVDSIPTSANQEDHVSMATHGAARLKDMAANAARIVAVELLVAAKGIDLRAPLKTSPRLGDVMALIRQTVPPAEGDHPLSGEIEAVAALIEAGRFKGFIDAILPSGRGGRS